MTTKRCKGSLSLAWTVDRGVICPVCKAKFHAKARKDGLAWVPVHK